MTSISELLPDKNPDIVIGLAFGDEGKGSLTSFLASQKKADNGKVLVVRFNGGHQAGHTVVKNGRKHVFSNFGSGTLDGIPTYWSKYCTVHPFGLLNEYNSIVESFAITPMIYFHPDCPITTPYDVHFNHIKAKITKHGSVGVGFGETIEREEKFHKLHVRDLYFEYGFVSKMESIKKYYVRKLHDMFITFNNVNEILQNYVDIVEKEESVFFDCVRNLIKEKVLSMTEQKPNEICNHLVFEGAQGIMLDQDHGFFPHVTRSSTTVKNAIEILKDCGIDHCNVYYVTRSYLTRHGNGPMPGEQQINLVNHENETNVSHEFQGDFRTGILSLEMLRYAIESNEFLMRDFQHTSNLGITCIDQTGTEITVSENNKTFNINVGNLYKEIGLYFKRVLYCDNYKGEFKHDI